MGEMQNGQKTQVQRTYEGCNGHSASISDREPGHVGSVAQPLREIGANRQNRVRGDLVRVVAGGIVSQLIADYEDQLGESQELIEREQRRIEKITKRLLNLKRLQEMQNEQSQE